MLYISVFIFISFIAFFETFFKSALWPLIAVVTLIILAAFRSENVGIDTIAYINDYNAHVFGSLATESFERGYVFLEKLSIFLGFHIWFFFAVIATISLMCLFFGYRRYTDLTALAILYYFSRFFLNREMNQIRAGVAAAMVLISLKYVDEEKPLRFIFIIVIAAQFHSSAYIMLLVYPFVKILKKFSTYVFQIYFLVLILFAIASNHITPILSSIVSALNVGSAYITYDGYVHSDGLKNPVLILQVTLSLILVYLLFRKKEKNIINWGVLSAYMISTLILVLFCQFGVFSGRLSTILATVEPLIFIALLERFFQKYLVLLIMCVISLTMLYVIYFHTGQIASYFEPYQFIFLK